MISTKKKEDVVVDLEQQFILRMPPPIAENLRKDVQSGLMNLKDKLSIELIPETHRGKVLYDGQLYSAKLVDLPCIIESYKTIDKKTLYKTADICQMLICKPDFGEESPDEAITSPKKKEKDKRFIWNHGLCPPFKNVRKRRFRKTLQKKFQEQPDLEKELRRLFSMDSQAIDVKWEVVYEEENNTNVNANNFLNAKSTESTANNNNNMNNMNNIIGDIGGNCDEKRQKFQEKESHQDRRVVIDAESRMTGIAEHEIFGEVSSSEDEDEVNQSDRNKKISQFDSEYRGLSPNLFSNDAENESVYQNDSNVEIHQVDPFESLDFLSTDANTDPDVSELHNRLSELGKTLEQLKEKRSLKKKEISMVTDESKIKELQSELDSINQEEKNKDQEYTILNSMLNQ